MAKQRGCMYEKQGAWWVKFILPPGQTWSRPGKPGKVHTKIEESVRTWFRAEGIDGKGKQGKDWASKLLTELNAKYYSGQTISPIDRHTTVEDLMNNLIATYEAEEKSAVKVAREKLLIFKRHHVDRMVSTQVTTDKMQDYRKQRMKLDGVESATVNRDFSVLRRAFRLGVRHTPPLVTAVPYLPFGKDCSRRQGYLTLDLYDALLALSEEDVRPFWVAGCHIGVRVGVLFKLRWPWIELWEDAINGVHGIVRIPGKVMKNSQGLTTVIFGDLGRELRRLKAIRDQHFPNQDLVFMRYDRRQVHTGPVMKAGAAQRLAYLNVAESCAAGTITSVEAARQLGKSPRFVNLLTSRLHHEGREAILRGALTLRERVGESHDLAGTAEQIERAIPLKYGYVRGRWDKMVGELGHPELVMHDMRRTALDIFKRAGLKKDECKRWLGHKTDSMFDWYSIDPDEKEIVNQGERVAASMAERRRAKLVAVS